MEMCVENSDRRVPELRGSRVDQKQLLIVDHQPSFTGFARLVAQKLGFRVSVLTESRKVAASLDAHLRSVLILEVVMPDFDGIEVISALAQKEFRGHLILVSGHEPAYIELAKKTAEAKGLKVIAALSKPIRQATLESTLRRIQLLD